MSDVFISYSSKEKADAMRIRRTLEINDISVWMAPESIPAGSSYPNELSSAISNCSVLVLVESENSLSSRWVLNEVLEAHNSGKKIIPFVIDNIKDSGFIFLNDAHSIFANEDGALELLVTTISIELKKQSNNKAIKKANGVLSQNKLTSKFNKMNYILDFACSFIFVIAAILCGIEADSYHGVSVATYSPYSSTPLSSGTIGGNSKAVAYFQQLQVICFIVAVVFFALGFFSLRKYKTFENKPTTYKYGRVISKNMLSVTVQFQDGTRSQITSSGEIILKEGDRGNFGIKDNVIVSFEREN